MLISGKTRCGKTNTVMHILRKPLVYYDKIYFYTPNQHQDKIVSLKKLMDDISEKVGYNVLELHNHNYEYIRISKQQPKSGRL